MVQWSPRTSRPIYWGCNVNLRMLAVGAMEFLELGTRGWFSLKLMAVGAREWIYGISSHRCQRHPLANHTATASMMPTLAPTHVRTKPDLMRHADICLAAISSSTDLIQKEPCANELTWRQARQEATSTLYTNISFMQVSSIGTSSRLLEAHPRSSYR